MFVVIIIVLVVIVITAMNIYKPMMGLKILSQVQESGSEPLTVKYCDYDRARIEFPFWRLATVVGGGLQILAVVPRASSINLSCGSEHIYTHLITL